MRGAVGVCAACVVATLVVEILIAALLGHLPAVLMVVPVAIIGAIAAPVVYRASDGPHPGPVALVLVPLLLASFIPALRVTPWTDTLGLPSSCGTVIYHADGGASEGPAGAQQCFERARASCVERSLHTSIDYGSVPEDDWESVRRKGLGCFLEERQFVGSWPSERIDRCVDLTDRCPSGFTRGQPQIPGGGSKSASLGAVAHPADQTVPVSVGRRT